MCLQYETKYSTNSMFLTWFITIEKNLGKWSLLISTELGDVKLKWCFYVLLKQCSFFECGCVHDHVASFNLL